MAAAARIAGLDRSQFFRMVKRQRIDLGGFNNRMLPNSQPN